MYIEGLGKDTAWHILKETNILLHMYSYVHIILANNLKMQNYNLDVSQYGCKKAPEGNCIAGIGKNWYSEYTSRLAVTIHVTCKKKINMKLQNVQFIISNFKNYNLAI